MRASLVRLKLNGWETIAMVERYSKSLTFDDALRLYRQVNGHGA